MPYEKLNLPNRTVLTAEHLAHMEAGIEEAFAASKPKEPVRIYGWRDVKTESGYIDTSGKVVANASFQASEMIEAAPGAEITYKVKGVNKVGYHLAVYDKNGSFLPSASLKTDVPNADAGTAQVVSGVFTIPDDVAYFRMMDRNDGWGGYFTYIEKPDSEDLTEWYGKKWFAFGTSITDTSYTNAETGAPTGKYVPYLAEMSGMLVNNYGIAGGTIGKTSDGLSGAEILNRILNTDVSEADLITIEGFVNDFACGTKIGDIGDTGGTSAVADADEITLCGALYRAVKYCLERAPKALVVLLTESTGKQYTLSNGQTADYRVTYKKAATGLYQKDYNDAIIEMGRFMGVRVIDAGSKSQINGFNPEYIVDQIHHTDLGGKQYATAIWDELKHITPKTTEV